MSKPPAENVQCEITARITKEFAQVTRALKTLGAGNHTVLRSTDEQELLQDMCSVIVETGGYPFAFVTYAVHDQAKSVRWMAGVGNNIELVKSYPFTWAANKAGGTVTGTAIRTGRQNFSSADGLRRTRVRQIPGTVDRRWLSIGLGISVANR
jgi:hypothetical protein